MSLDSILGALEAAGLIQPVTQSQEVEFQFRHELIHATTYTSLLKSDRRSLHLTIGEVIEEAYSDLPGDQAALTAWHFDEAEETGRALRYYELAGDAASQVYAIPEAEAYFKRALEIAKSIEKSDYPFNQLYFKLGRILELGSKHTQAIHLYQELKSAAQTKGDHPIVFEAQLAEAKMYSMPHPGQNPELARQLLEEALVFARQQNNRGKEARVLWNLLVLQVYGEGQAGEQAIQTGLEALAISRELNLHELTAFTLNDLTYAYLGINQPKEAQKVQRQATQKWKALKNLPMLADSLSTAVFIHFLLGNYQQAIGAAGEALKTSIAAQNLFGQAGSRIFLGSVYHEIGQTDQSKAAFEAAISLGDQSGHLGASIVGRSNLGWLLGDLGDVQEALEIVQQAYSIASKTQVWFQPIWPLSVLFRLQLRQGAYQDSQSTLEKIRQIDHPTGLRWLAPIFVPLGEAELALALQDHRRAVRALEPLWAYFQQTGVHTYYSEALYLKSKHESATGQTDKARATLLKARKAAELSGSQRSLWLILGDLAQIEAASNHHKQAENLRYAAQQVIQYILEHTSQADLRNIFLARPEVHRLMRSLKQE